MKHKQKAKQNVKSEFTTEREDATCLFAETAIFSEKG